ncbi:MAG: DUF3303 family protein [Bryobacteraceae bacterium]
MFKISMPVEAGNAAAKTGFSAIRDILAEQKPEAVYFVTDAGRRTAFMIVHMDDLSQLPAIAEPWFLALNASIEVAPAMTPEDLMKAGPAVAQAVKAYG